jgi:hypothetical protein
MVQLKAIQNTIFKLQPIDSSMLPDDQKVMISANSMLNVQSFDYAGNHIRLVLADESIKGNSVWFAYQPHVQLLNDGAPVTPSTVQLNVPYKSQVDNEKNPFGSCNVTSIAMCLAYFGVQGNSPGRQLEDELQDWLEERGLDRHDPEHLVQVATAYGCQDHFKTDVTVEEVKQWLAAGNPIVTHGFFTSSGHIVCVIGYNDKGFIVHDPYGEWYADGYDRNDDVNPEKGKAVTYSYGMMQEICMCDGQFWVHFLSK